MSLQLKDIRQDTTGTLLLTETQYADLCDEARATMPDSGADRDNGTFEHEWINLYLGTNDWLFIAD